MWRSHSSQGKQGNKLPIEEAITSWSDTTNPFQPIEQQEGPPTVVLQAANQVSRPAMTRPALLHQIGLGDLVWLFRNPRS